MSQIAVFDIRAHTNPLGLWVLVWGLEKCVVVAFDCSPTLASCPLPVQPFPPVHFRQCKRRKGKVILEPEQAKQNVEVKLQ